MKKPLFEHFFSLFKKSDASAQKGFVQEDVSLHDDEDKFWQSVYQARAAFYEARFGKLPRDILKLFDLSVIWAGGGLFKIKAEKLGDDLWVYSSFGLSNPDMPTGVAQAEVERDIEDGLLTEVSATLQRKEDVPSYPDRPGYGYEVLVLAEGESDWALSILQWAVKAEILNDMDILGRVEKYKGLTIEDIDMGEDGLVNILFSKAKAPLPQTGELPNGPMQLLVATTITDDEMVWSMENGRDNLLAKLQKAGIGQVSHKARNSVINPEPIDFTAVKSRDAAEDLKLKGLLRKVYLFPLDFGGKDNDPNITFLPKAAAVEKRLFDDEILELVEQGLISKYNARPEYQGDSFVPKRILIEATGQKEVRRMVEVF